MTKWIFHREFLFKARRVALLYVLALVLPVGQSSQVAFCSDAKESVALAGENPGEPGSQHVSAVRNGVLETKDGLTLRLTTDLGPVKITQLDAGAAPVVRYTVHIETDARGPAAMPLLKNYALKALSTPTGVEITGSVPAQAARSSNAQFWVQFEVAVPRNYSVVVSTEAGDIITDDIGGAASLKTQGGNIYAGRIGASDFGREFSRARPLAKLETEGGHIKVLDVAGDLSAFTGGGFIDAGNIAGDATLRSGGGHIRAGRIGGRGELETAGGNITVGQAGSFVSVHTGGGQIDFGEVRGSVRAQTGGGGIHVMYVSGPIEVESNGGSICLTGVAGAVQAATAGGTIRAWINPASAGDGPVRLGGASQLSSGTGDIIVYLPRNLAVNIDATVVNGSEHHIEADPALHLVVQGPANGNGLVHAVGPLNGGGTLLKLHTLGGKIRLQYLDAELALRESLIREQKVRLNERLGEGRLPPFVGPVPPIDNPPRQAQPGPPKSLGDLLEDWLSDWERKFRGGDSEDPDDFLKLITYRPPPSYPALAQRAGIHGFVILQVKFTKDGRIEVRKVLEGEPVLADAAIDAVKRWRGKPKVVKGKQVDVFSTVKFDFQLR